MICSKASTRQIICKSIVISESNYLLEFNTNIYNSDFKMSNKKN